MVISPFAGKIAEQDIPLNIPRLVMPYYTRVPGSHISCQRVEFGTFYDRIEAKATAEQKEKLSRILCRTSPQIKHKEFAGEEIKLILTNAPGNNAPTGGVKVTTENGLVCSTPIRNRRYL